MFDKRQVRHEIINFYSKYKPSRFWNTPSWYGDKLYIYNYVNEYYKDIPELNNLSFARKCYHIIHDLNYLPKTTYKGFYKGYYDIDNITSLSNLFKQYNLINFDFNKSSKLLDKNELKKIILYKLKNQKYKELLNDYILNYSINFYTQNIKDWEIKYLFIIHDGNIYCPICGKLKKHKKIATLQSTCGDLNCKHIYLSNISKTKDISYLRDPEIIKRKTESRKGYKHSIETIQKISESNKKTWNKEKRQLLVNKNKENGVYEKQSKTMKNKILNGEYTPKTENRFTHKNLLSNITNCKYRSSWELKFHETHPDLLYEKIRIPYIYNSKKHIYIIDFVNPNTKELIEIKPSSLIENEKNKCKFNAAYKWANENNYKFIILTEDTLNNY